MLLLHAQTSTVEAIPWIRTNTPHARKGTANALLVDVLHGVEVEAVVVEDEEELVVQRPAQRLALQHALQLLQ